jgi:hypothetical protein
MGKILVAIALMGAAAAAVAAPRIVAVSVKEGSSASEVIITVTIERPTPLDLTCAASIDPGDGGRGPTISWDVGERRTKTTRYDYKKPGTYTLKASGGGNDPCGGSAQATVNVGPKGVKPVAAKGGKPGCPDGWELASSRGARYTCRVKNPTLTCAEGTKYFSGKGEIGCK